MSDLNLTIIAPHCPQSDQCPRDNQITFHITIFQTHPYSYVIVGAYHIAQSNPRITLMNCYLFLSKIITCTFGGMLWENILGLALTSSGIACAVRRCQRGDASCGSAAISFET